MHSYLDLFFIFWLIVFLFITYPVWNSSNCSCDMTHWYVWHDSFTCVTWLIDVCDMTHSYVGHFVKLFLLINESCHTCEWVMSHTSMSHVTHVNESCHTFICGTFRQTVLHALHPHPHSFASTFVFCCFCIAGFSVFVILEWLYSYFLICSWFVKFVFLDWFSIPFLWLVWLDSSFLNDCIISWSPLNSLYSYFLIYSEFNKFLFLFSLYSSFLIYHTLIPWFCLDSLHSYFWNCSRFNNFLCLVSLNLLYLISHIFISWFVFDSLFSYFLFLELLYIDIVVPSFLLSWFI